MSHMTAETFFIDMKYVSLYHKLGFQEINLDMYEKAYSSSVIKIESESQRYFFKNKWYPLKNHYDFVILELIDFLLTKETMGFEIFIEGKEVHLSQDQVKVKIRCEQWGNDFNAVKYSDVHDDILYTSRLLGGLIDREYIIKIGENKEYVDFFVKLIEEFFPQVFNSMDEIIDQDFQIQGTVLKKYKGINKNVSVPEGIDKIESGAFWNNTSVEQIDIPESVTKIGGDAFAYCYNLKKINIPPSVRVIGDNPFAGCSDLLIDNKSPYFLLIDGVLFTRDKMRLIHYSPFLENREFIVPEDTEWIGKHSFYDCKNLKEVTLGRRVNYIGNNPFSDCENIILKNESPYFIYSDGALLDKGKTTIFHYSLGVNQDQYVVPDTVRTIGRNSFWNCKRIKKIILGKNIRQIGYNPFANCSNLEIVSESPYFRVIDGVLYDDNVKEVFCCTSNAARHGVLIPEGVMNIGRNSFAGCVSLKTIVIPESVGAIGRGAFSGCKNLEQISIPKSVTSIEKWAFSGCDKLRYIEIDNETIIANDAINSNTKVVRK